MTRSAMNRILPARRPKSKEASPPPAPTPDTDPLAAYAGHLERRGLSPRTLELYSECLRAFRRFLAEIGGRHPLAATHTDLMDFHVWLTRQEKRRGGSFSAAYRSTHVTVVKGLYRWLYAEGLVPVDQGKRLRLPRLGKHLSRNVLNFGETRRLLAAPARSPAALRDRLILRIFALSGLRASELAGLDVTDVSLAARELTVRRGKGAKDRLVFFDRDTARHLARYLAKARPRLAGAEQPALLVDDNQLRLRPFQLRRIVKRGTRRAGIDRHITCHSLRHTFCTNLLRAGANLKTIAELAGHTSLETTAKYTRVDISDLAAVYRAAHPRAGGRP